MTERVRRGLRMPGHLVEQARSWSDDDGWRLEVAAFCEHRGVLMALARKMPMQVWRDVLKAQQSTRFADILNGICHLVSLVAAYVLAPVLAIRCLVLTFRGFDDPLIAWQLGSVALVAAASVFYPLFRWRNEANDRWTWVIVIGVLASIVVHLATGLTAWQQESLDGSPLWLSAVALGVALSVANLLIATRAGRGVSRIPAEELAARLPHEEQTRIRSELTAAIALLAHHGMVSGDVAQQAQQLRLGALGSTLGSSRPETGEANPAGAIFNG